MELLCLSVDGERAVGTNQVSADKSPIAQALHRLYSVFCDQCDMLLLSLSLNNKGPCLSCCLQVTDISHLL